MYFLSVQWVLEASKHNPGIGWAFKRVSPCLFLKLNLRCTQTVLLFISGSTTPLTAIIGGTVAAVILLVLCVVLYIKIPNREQRLKKEREVNVPLPYGQRDLLPPDVPAAPYQPPVAPYQPPARRPPAGAPKIQVGVVDRLLGKARNLEQNPAKPDMNNKLSSVWKYSGRDDETHPRDSNIRQKHLRNTSQTHALSVRSSSSRHTSNTVTAILHQSTIIGVQHKLHPTRDWSGSRNVYSQSRDDEQG